MKYIRARLKNQVEVSSSLDGIDFNRDWLEASSIIEYTKREMISQIKSEMHKAIAELSIDDIEFKIFS